MSFQANHFLNRALIARESDHSLRRLSHTKNLADFCSNDYLGYSRNQTIAERTLAIHIEMGSSINGSTGSRLISGNSHLCEMLEKDIASFHGAEKALIFNSGYDANIGLLSSVPQRADTILYDELIHASLRDGIRLSYADSFSFIHNDLGFLESRLKKANNNIFVVVESVYSMDGDFAPLREMVGICKKYNAHLIVDEAHASGIFGEQGRGLVSHFNMEGQVFARMHTFGKALGCHGAAVLGSEILVNYLINFSRSFIYTTALPPHSLAGIKAAYEYMMKDEQGRKSIHACIAYFREKANGISKMHLINSASPIQGLIVPGNEMVRKSSKFLQDAGFDIRPIMSPTVPKGKERLRICLHSFNTQEEVDILVNLLQEIMEEI